MLSTVISELGVTLYQIWVVRKNLNFSELFSDSWKYLLASIVMFLPVYWMNGHIATSWLMLILEVLVGIVIYTVMVFILRPQVLKNAKHVINERRKR